MNAPFMLAHTTAAVFFGPIELAITPPTNARLMVLSQSPKSLVAQVHHALKIPQFGGPLETLMKLRENHRMLRQKDFARFAQMVQVGGCDRLELIERRELTRKNFEIARAKLFGAVRNQVQAKIVARGIVEVDSADGDFGLARNHLDSRAFQPMLGEDFRGGGEDSLPARPPFAPMPFLNAHLTTRNE